MIKIHPKKLAGSVRIVESKSVAHRAIICAALADSKSYITPVSRSSDLLATIGAVNSLGARTKFVGEALEVEPIAKCPTWPVVVDCCESASTLRFLLPVVGALGVSALFIAGKSLEQRPILSYLECLAKAGLQIKGSNFPIEVSGRMHPGRFVVPGDISSQFISGLLLALPLLGQGSEVVLSTLLESQPYVDLTLKVASEFGATIQKTKTGWKLPEFAGYKGREFEVEGDWSNAAFFACASALGSKIELLNLDECSVQADRSCLDFLLRFGAESEFRNGRLFVKNSNLRGSSLDLRHSPDLLPMLAVVGAFAQGKTVISGVARARLKESDRVNAMCENLQALGSIVFQRPDGLIIQGRRTLGGGKVCGFGDHRIVMAMAMAATVCEQDVLISDAESVLKSYPGFWEEYRKLGGVYDGINVG